MNLEQVIEKNGGLVPLDVKSDYVGIVTIGLNYKQFCEYLLENDKYCVTDGKRKLYFAQATQQQYEV